MGRRRCRASVFMRTETPPACRETAGKKNNMRVLMLGKNSSWMGLHLSHIEAAFRRRGHDIRVGDYHRMATLCGIPLPREMAREQLQRSLEHLVKRFQPDLIYCVASWKYDFPRLKSYFKGVVAIHDLDGPRSPLPEVLAGFREADLPLTASRYMVRLAEEQGVTAYYLPSAADPDYYAPTTLTARESRLFSAPVSYIGRATERRVKYCSLLKEKGLALYGNRWRNHRAAREAGLDRCARLDRNVAGRELVKIYQASGSVINILQEPLEHYLTILSLQCFAVPSTGKCLVAEWVEEAEEAFEPDREILLFRTPEELLSQEERCLGDPEFARKIGEAARRRCLECHTHDHRVAEIERLLSARPAEIPRRH